MISNRFYFAIRILVPIGFHLGIIKFTYNSKSKCLRLPPKTKHIFKFNIVLMFMWVAFISLQMYSSWKTKDYMSVNLIFPFLIGGFVASLTILLVNDPDGGFVLGANTFLNYLQRINHLYMPNHDPNTDKFVKLLDTMMLLILLATLSMLAINCLPCILFPRIPIFFGSVISSNAPLAIRVLIIVYHCYICIPMYGTLFVCFCGVTVFAALILPFFSKEFCLGRKSYKSISKLRRVDILIIEYRAAQILQSTFNQVVGKVLIPFQALATLLFIVSSFIAIRHWNTMNIITLALMICWAAASPVVWILVLMTGACVFKSGNRTLNSWRYHQRYMKSQTDRKLLAKFRRSCRPLCMAYKKMYTIRPTSTMVFARGCMKGLMRALLTVN